MFQCERKSTMRIYFAWVVCAFCCWTLSKVAQAQETVGDGGEKPLIHRSDRFRECIWAGQSSICSRVCSASTFDDAGDTTSAYCLLTSPFIELVERLKHE